MSDAPVADPGTTAEPASSPAPASPAPDVGGAAPGAGDLLSGDLDPSQAVFDRGYVTKVRGEAQRYRDEAKAAADKLGTYDTVFSGYDDADRQVWLDLARTWATDPSQAATVMQQIANAVLTPGDGDGSAPATSDGDDGDGAGSTDNLTPERVQQMITEALGAQQRAHAEQKAIDEVYAEVRAGGYDPEGMEGLMVMWQANHNTNGDIGAAIKSMGAYRQSIIDEYVQGRTNGRGPTPSPSNGTVATGSVEIKTLEDARRAADAFIKAQAGASTP